MNYNLAFSCDRKSNFNLLEIIIKKNINLSLIFAEENDLVKKKFDEKVKIISKKKLLKNYFVRNKKITIPAKFLNYLNENYWIYLQVLDRNRNFFEDIKTDKEKFINICLNCYSLFLENNVNSIFFSSTPHFAIEVCIYLVSKYLENKIFILRRTDFKNKYFLSNSIELIEKNLYKNKISSDFKTDLENESFFIKKSKKKDVQKFTYINSFFDFIIFSFNILKIFIFKPSLLFSNSSFELEEKKNRFGTCKLLFEKNINDLRYKLFYLKHSTQINFEKNYVYFPLHLSPERSTEPEGLIYHDQFLVIKILSKLLPKNWYVYVKEHPNQFQKTYIPDLRKKYVRKLKDIENINMFNNVIICKINSDTEKLIKNSKIVATITGSSGWEALKMNKPTLNFAKTWYSNCDSCFSVNDINDDLFDQIYEFIKLKNQNVIKNDVENFLNSINNYLFDYPSDSFYEEKEIKENLLNTKNNDYSKFVQQIEKI